MLVWGQKLIMNMIARSLSDNTDDTGGVNEQKPTF